MPEEKKTRGETGFRLNRRALMQSSGAFGVGLAGFLVASEAGAQGVHGFKKRVKKYQDYKRKNPAPSQSWLDGILPKSEQKVDPASTPHPGLFQAATGCTEIGNRARLYCTDAISKGDANLKPCLQSVEAMIPVCNALGKLAELDAGRLKDMAKTTLVFVEDCQRECLAQKAAHPSLQVCIDSCAHCSREIRGLLKA